MKNQKLHKIIFIILFFTALSAPLIMTQISALTGFTLDKPLKGYYASCPKPIFIPAAIMDSSYQENYTAYFHNEFSPRGVMITLNNEFRFRLFHESGQVVVGRDHYLFENIYAYEHYCTEGYDFSVAKEDAGMCEFVHKIDVISQELSKRGKSFLIFLGTSKADYYEEKIPKKYKRMGNPQGITAADSFKRYLSDTNVIFLDCEEYLNSISFDYPVYYASGIHWSRPAEQAVEAELLKILHEQCNRDVEQYSFGQVHKQTAPYERDADLLELLNIYSSIHETYYEYEVIPTPAMTETNILIQGDSYSEYIAKDLVANGHKGKISQLTYGEIMHINDSSSYEVSNLSELDFEKLVNENDIFIIGYTKPKLKEYGYGYVDALYEYLTTDTEVTSNGF